MKRTASNCSLNANQTEETLQMKDLIDMKRNPDQSRRESRLVWNNRVEYLLNIVGYTVGLGNVWRFPYLCFKNGGGAFLIPYFTTAAILGFPMLFVETSVGQFTQRGCIGSWNLVPILKGVGFSSLMLSWYYISYTMVVMAWILFYLCHSFTFDDLPWATCDNYWNTEACRPAVGDFGSLVMKNESLNRTTSSNYTFASNKSVTSTGEFWNNYVLRRTEGIHDMGSLSNWRMVLCFIAAWSLCYLCTWKGIRTTGKVAYITVVSPYIILLILLVRGATLEGAGSGISYLIYPNLQKLLEPQVWLEAGGQVLYTLAVGFSVMYGLSSYTAFHSDCYKNAIICVGVCCATSIFVAVVLFSYLGHIAHVQNKNITEIAEQGPGLVFEVFPAGITLLPASQIWAVIFFLMLIFFAIDTAFASVEGITRLLEDVRPQWFVCPSRIHASRVLMCFVPFVLGIPMLFEGGIYVFELVNMYGNSAICILLVAFAEVTGLSWIYGVNKFFDNIKMMIGYYPNVLVKCCWSVIDPFIIMAILVASCVQYQPLKLGDYVYPVWADIIGWILILIALASIPIYAFKSMLQAKGSISQRWKVTSTSKVVTPGLSVDGSIQLVARS